MYAVGVAAAPEAVSAIDERVDAVRSSLAPWLSRSAYFNFAERDVHPSAFYQAGVYERLARIRAEMDPEGVFRAKHAID